MQKKAENADDYVRHSEVTVGSERSFGIVFAVVFAIIALWPLINGNELRYWAAIVALIFLLLAFLMPRVLAPLNIIWFKFGLLLHHIVNPVVMGIMFFVVLTPAAIVLKVMNKDLLRLRLDKDLKSYWIERDPPGPEPESMRNQF